MKRITWTCLIICLVALGPYSAQVWAQDTPVTDALSVRQSINHLKQQLEFLVAISSDFPNDQLSNLVQRIREHILKAERALANRQGNIAKLEIAAANRLITSAMGAVLRGPLTSLREQLEEKLRRIEQLLSQGFRQDVQRLFQKAQTNKNEAELAFRSGSQNKGLQLLQIAIFNANQALDLLASAGGNDLQRAYQEEKANFDQLAHQVQNLPTSDFRATDLQSQTNNVCQGLYRDALEQRKKAESAFARGQLRLAVDTYRWATRLLLRAIDLCQPTRAANIGDAQSLEHLARSELTSTQQLLDNITASANPGPDDPVAQMIRRARNVFADAQRSFDSGNYRSAITKANLAKMILNRIKRLASAGGQQADVSLNPDIQMLQGLLSDLENSLEGQNRPMAQRLFDLARNYFDLAVRASQMGRPALATARLFAATKFALSVKAILAGTDPSRNLSAEAAQALNQFEQRYQSISGRASQSADSMVTAWLGLASEIYRAAQEAKAAQRLPEMLHNARVGLEILQRIERRLNQAGN